MIQLPASAILPPLLLATDGSPSAQMAQSLVRAIAELWLAQVQTNSQSVVTVVMVQPRPAQRRLPLLRKASQRATPPLLAPAKTEEKLSEASVPALEFSTLSPERLTELLRVDFPNHFPLSVQVRQGRPTTEILNCARTIQAGLIAVGHRGVGGLREVLLGSVSTAIARYAPCSVLVARTAKESELASLRHVLLVVENSIAARQALATTRHLVPAGIQTITLLHVQSPLNASYLVAPFVARTPSWQLSQSLQAAQREQSEQILQQAAAELKLPNLTVHTRLQTGDSGPSICQVAEEIGATLVILGSDATRRSLLSPLQAMRLPRQKNSTANTPTILRNTRLSITDDYVIHYAPCPVLLCRAVAIAASA